MELRKGTDYTGISVVFLCHDGLEHFLLHKRSQTCRDEQGTWDCGGGGVEFGDTVEETLHKEVMEEYCATIISYQFLGYGDVFRESEGKPTHWLAFHF